ncbi:Histidine kinase [Methanocaldococcus lauensis]|uniref:Histidine kinase n=1 Tax=Methanocaldococcus lauensis TaxID=2546128 RepID=A0A8D6PRK2_9EURY|nr:2TM domain-containing protein [Methanocaldococcus lauensis]CAB3288586.1 Histidine kinase [Methanocaldococcus lauensis]
MVSEIPLDVYKKVYREIIKEKKKRKFLIHLIIYIIVNAMFIVDNLLYTPKEIWFIYPLIFWGIGLLIHYLYGIHWIDNILKDIEARAEYRAREILKNNIHQN